MKHLKSTSQDLREMFARNVAVRHIAEPLASFDLETPPSTLLAFMDEHDYDVVGVRRDGLVEGYVERVSLRGARTPEVYRPFADGDLIEDAAPLLEALEPMCQSPRLFVRALDTVAGIVTRGDFQKAPVRLWLFGLISLLEMQMLRLIREAYPGESWTELVARGSCARAQNLLRKRKHYNVNIDLADCLQFADRRTILVNDDRFLDALGLGGRSEAETFLDTLQQLRNDLAHGQDIVTGRWPDIVHLARQAECCLRACEGTTLQPATQSGASNSGYTATP